MNKLLAAAAVLACLVVPAVGSAADARDITVVNATGKPVYSLFISPVGIETWEEDVLGVDVLADGESVRIEFSGYADDQCSFDILATNEDGDEWLLPDVDLCSVSEVVIAAEYIRAE